MTHVIILAGGKGTRLRASPESPKVLLPMSGIPLINRVLRAVAPLCARPTIVVGFGADSIIQATGNRYHYVRQEEQLGTGHAVLCARDELRGRSDIDSIIVLYGDHPFVSAESLQRLASLRASKNAVLTLATITIPDFTGEYQAFTRFGRIVRDASGGVKIVEFKDADEKTRAVREVNPGYYCFKPDWLWDRIGTLSRENAAGEYYLTDLVEMAVAEGSRVDSFTIEDPHEGMGINTEEEYAVAEAWARRSGVSSTNNESITNKRIDS